MIRFNPEKTVSANSNGVVISYRDTNKNMYFPYENQLVKEIQVNGTTKYQKLDVFVHFSPKQKEIYQKTVYGFKAYTQEELCKMSEKNKTSIIITYTKVQRLLTRWKQDTVFSAVDNFLSSLFPKSVIIKQMIETKGYLDDQEDVSEIRFSDLGMNPTKIASKLVEAGLLPKNFFQLA